MNSDLVFHNKVKNLIHTVVLLIIMATVTGLAAYMVAGTDGVWFAVFGSVIPILFYGNSTTEHLIRVRGAKPLSQIQHPRLYQVVSTLARRAGLSHIPQLFYEPSGTMNAYATGRREKPVIVLTDALLRNLNMRDITGILGHEIAHIRNNDLKVMLMADSVQRITGFISIFGQMVLLLAMPLVIVGKVSISLVPMLFIVFAPTIVLALQMALSRTREFEADLVGSELTGDPAGLAQALYKLEHYHRNYWRSLLFTPWRSYRAPSLLQTHPPIAQRIRRIMAMALVDSPRADVYTTDHWQPHGRQSKRSPLSVRRMRCLNC
ncbi:zinc metalloprotease HtpX [Desulfosediminicola flagellatus]|uniref:zinc metalloprotease HtpX n=1 Tax=Desulfosediminicola flagellatus TaxID=2569541 RepID=UPI0010ABD9E1|nr:zinc metalloprotease HtpX [Desulfosediminicola flagellatus]